MVNKTVISVNMECFKCKKDAFNCLKKICGIDSIDFNTKEKTITVVGEADPVCMTIQLRRKFKCAHLVSYGPLPPPKKDPPKPPKEDKQTQTTPPPPCCCSASSCKWKPPPCSCASSPCSCTCKHLPPPKKKEDPPPPPPCFCGCSPCSCGGKPPPCSCGWSPCSCIREPPPPPPTTTTAPRCWCGWSPCSCGWEKGVYGVYVVEEETPLCTIC